MENLGRSFSYMFEDEDWFQKILIGAAFCLLSLVLIGIPFVLGYLLQVARQSSHGKELPLPAWDNLGDKFVSGLLFFCDRDSLQHSSGDHLFCADIHSPYRLVGDAFPWHSIRTDFPLYRRAFCPYGQYRRCL